MPHRETWTSRDASGEKQETGLFKAPPLTLEPFGWWELVEQFIEVQGIGSIVVVIVSPEAPCLDEVTSTSSRELG